MSQKSFFKAFNILYLSVKDVLNIYQKENFYRLLFKDVYALANDGLYDDDSIRKRTSGNDTIHLKAIKKLHTVEGFEVFRKGVEDNLLPYLSDKNTIISQLNNLCQEDDLIPEQLKSGIKCNLCTSTPYQESKIISAILDCLNYSDYLKTKGKTDFVDISYIRLSADKPLAKYPKFITESPNAAVEELIGRENELKEIYDTVIKDNGKLLVSAVGGLGKTELVKRFLDTVIQAETETTGVEVIAWIPYDNVDIRASMKEALHLQCELEDVWFKVQELVVDYGNRMLLVIDNIESAEDEYLSKLVNLQCRVILTSRQREIPGFKKVLDLEPLSIEACRELFYKHYQFDERNNELVNDIIALTAKHTIMIVFIAKVACLEEMSLKELYEKLTEKGFKLSEEDVSCEHERLRNDNTIITQMCILFSLVKYSEADKKILTNISIIPNIRFDFSKAKKWFGVKKNSNLMKLFKMGMLEQITSDRKHIYWMHSVIAATIREQQKEHLYDLSRPFVDILSEELGLSVENGKEHEKASYIFISWSVADIMDNHWHTESDTTFLTNLFHVCFACSSYHLSEKLINRVIDIQKDPDNGFPVLELAYSYRNKIDLLLHFDRANEAADLLKIIEQLFDDNNIPTEERNILNYQYGVLYQVRADYPKSRVYFQNCIDLAMSEDEENYSDLAVAYSNMGRMLVDAGEYVEAYGFIKQSIEYDTEEDTAAKMISYCTLADICSELVGSGYWQYYEEAKESFKRVIKFREDNLGKQHSDTAVAYQEYASFLLNVGRADRSFLSKALKYVNMANDIQVKLFSEHSITIMRNLNTKALILDEMGYHNDAFDIFEGIIKSTENMSDDYLTDLATFINNYAQAQRDVGMIDEAMPNYLRSIDIWNSLSDYGNLHLVYAYKGYGECLYVKGYVENAIDNFEAAANLIKEDLNFKITLWDTIAILYCMIDKIKESVDYFVKLLKELTAYKVYDDETKFDTCENLANILEAREPHEKKIKSLILDELKSEPAVLEYIDDFFKKVQKNRTIDITD